MIKVLKQALDALQANEQLINGTGTNGGLAYCIDAYYSDCFDVDPINKQTDAAIAAIKEALAQRTGPVTEESSVARTWVGLTEDELIEAWHWGGCDPHIEGAHFKALYQYIEAKLKLGNHVAQKTD